MLIRYEGEALIKLKAEINLNQIITYVEPLLKILVAEKTAMHTVYKA